MNSIKMYLILFKIVPKRFRYGMLSLLLLYTIGGALDMLGVASIMPFISVLTNPDAFASSSIGKIILNHTGVAVQNLPIYKVGIVVLILFVLGNLVNFGSLWISIRFAAKLNVCVVGEIVDGFFGRGYEFIKKSSPSVHANYTIKEVDRAIGGGVLQMCFLVSKVLNVILILCFLSIASLQFTFAFASVATVFYFVFFLYSKKRMLEAGSDIVHAGACTLRCVTNIFTSSKEIIVRGNLSYFIVVLQHWLIKCHKSDEVARIFPTFPKYVMESVAFIMLLSVPIYQSYAGLDYKESVPLVALFAYSGYKILPALQQAFSSLSILKFNAPVLEYLSENLELGRAIDLPKLRIREFNKCIELENVSYSAPQKNDLILNNISLVITSGEKVAIIGKSGSGKTTLLDILLGLIRPTDGEIVIDGEIVSHAFFSWHTSALGYAPQSPMLLDTSLAENVSYGLPFSKIDFDACLKSIETAQAQDFVSLMPDGLHEIVGPAGRVLSGGEVQRIAVARALYHDPDVLILDEPTSALDPVIAARLFEQLTAPNFSKTVIVVTHDWDNLSRFDKIVVMKHGRITNVGTYDEIEPSIVQLRNQDSSYS